MEPATFTQTNPYGFTREQMIENFVDATRLAYETRDKHWTEQSDKFLKYGEANGISNAEMLNAYFGIE